MTPYEYAISKCKEIPHTRGYSRHYCVVSTKRGKIVGEGANNYIKTSPIVARASKKAGKPDKQCLCSEAVALIRDRYRKGYRLTVVRLDAKDCPCYSEPCLVCREMLKLYNNIRIIEFSM